MGQSLTPENEMALEKMINRTGTISIVTFDTRQLGIDPSGGWKFSALRGYIEYYQTIGFQITYDRTQQIWRDNPQNAASDLQQISTSEDRIFIPLCESIDDSIATILLYVDMIMTIGMWADQAEKQRKSQ